MKWGKYILVISTIAVLILGQICKLSFKDCGISKIKSYSDIVKLNCNVEYIFGEDKEDEETIYNSLKQYENDYISGVQQSDVIIVGVATGKYNQQAGSFCQEVKVVSVIKGDSVSNNELINIYGLDGFEIRDRNKPFYTNSLNIMSENSRYLIFLNNIEVNKYRNEKNSFLLEGSYFCYLNLDKSSDYPIAIEKEHVKFNALKEYEYFTTSDRILKQIQIIKEKIIEETIN